MVQVLTGVLGAMVFVISVFVIIAEGWDDRQDARKRRRQSIGFMDELEALELQRERKRQVFYQLRETARQARRDRD